MERSGIKVAALVVYPGNADAPSGELARRLCEALADVALDATRLPADDVGRTAAGDPSHTRLLVVDPAGCAASLGNSRTSDFLAGVRRAERRVAVVPGDPAGGEHGERALAAHFDAVVELGLSAPENGRSPSGTPYRFVPDGPTDRERRTINDPKPAERPLPWTLVGTNDADHAALVAGLVEEVDPGGLALLGDAGELGGRDLTKVLSRTRCYVWRRRPSGYRESHQYLRALMCGAAPCAIGPPSSTMHEVPGVLSSVEVLRSTLDNGGAGVIYEAARRFYLGRENPGAALREVLRA